MSWSRQVFAFISVFVLAIGFIWFGISYVVLYHPQALPGFNRWVPKESGLVEDYSQLDVAGQNASGAINATSIVVYSDALPQNNSSVLASIGQLEKENIIVVYSIGSDEPVSFISAVAQYGFQGVFLSGPVSNYSLADINLIVNRTAEMGGFVMVNSSLVGSIYNSSNVASVYLFQENYISWINFVRQSGEKGIQYGKYWVNVQNVSREYLSSAVRSFLSLGVRYFSIDYGKMNYTQTMILISLENDTGPGPGMVPSSWHVSTDDFISNTPILNGTLYSMSSDTSLYGSLENYSGPGNFTYQIIGVNTSYGYTSFISQNASVVTRYNSYNLTEVETSVFTRGPEIYGSVAAVYSGSNFTTSGMVAVYTSAFSLENGSLLASNITAFTGGNGWTFSALLTSGKLITISSAIITNFSNGYIQSTTFADYLSVYSLINGSKLLTRQFGPPPVSMGSVGGSGWGAGIVDGNLLELTVTFSGNYTLTSRYLIDITSNVTLLSSTNSSLGSNFIVSAGNLYFTLSNKSGGVNLEDVNLSTLQERTLFTLDTAHVSSLVYLGDGFLVTYNGSVAKLGMNGSILWRAQLPEVIPNGYGYDFSPLLTGNGTALIGSTISAESVLQSQYSQEFELISLSNGTIQSTYYNNFSISPVGNPPGLPPSPNVYIPLAYAGGYLIYGCTFGNGDIFGARV